MQTAVIRVPDNKYTLIKIIVNSLNGKIRSIDEDGIREEILAKLVDSPLEKEEIIAEKLIRKDFRKHGIDLYG